MVVRAKVPGGRWPQFIILVKHLTMCILIGVKIHIASVFLSLNETMTLVPRVCVYVQDSVGSTVTEGVS